MADNHLNGKTIPWEQYLQYLKHHKKTIKGFLSQFENEIFTKKQIESFLPKAFLQLHKHIGKILEDNEVAVQEKNPKVELIASTVMKLQNQFLLANKNNQQQQTSIQDVIQSMKPEIDQQFGEMSVEISKVLTNMSGLFEQNITQVKQWMKELETNMMNAFMQESNELKLRLEQLSIQENQQQLPVNQLSQTHTLNCSKPKTSRMLAKVQLPSSSQKQIKIQDEIYQPQEINAKKESSGPTMLSKFIDSFLKNSKCATKEEEKQYLHQLLGNKQLVTTLLYRGSDHGWLKKDYKSRYERQKPAIFLFKVKDGDCIGEYKLNFLSSFGGIQDNMLFNLSCKRNFPDQKKDFARKHNQAGTTFIYGDWELEANNEPFNGEGNFTSYAKREGYNIPLNETRLNMLTNKKDGKFTISELEVWELTNTE